MANQAVEKFLAQCLHDYKNQMDIYFSVAETKSDLREGHAKVRKGLLALLKCKWSRNFPNFEYSTDTKDKLEKQMEEKYELYRVKLGEKFKNQEKPISLDPDSIPALGIDLGTTMCCVSVYHQGKLQIVPNRAQASSRTTPSYIGFHEKGSTTFGDTAKSQAHRLPETTVYDVKRMIGLPWTDENIRKNIADWPFDLENERNHVKIKCWNKIYKPQDVSGILLSHLKAMAEAFLQLPSGSITKAVITVPAYFTEAQRRATRDAAEQAGLEVLNILSEPTAAAIAYNWNRKEDQPKHVVVYDLGGGTFDIAIAQVGPTGVHVLGVDGNTHLGGRDIDQLLMEYCIKEFKNLENIDIRHDIKGPGKAARAIARIKAQCEKIKAILSSAMEAELDIASIAQGVDMVIPITRQTLEELARPLIQTTIEIVDRAIDDAKIRGLKGKKDIQEIILVGGSTKMPLVVSMLEEYFECPTFQQINPDEAVAHGAAIQAAIITGKLEGLQEFEIKDVTPLSLGIECENEKVFVMIPRNTTLPYEYEKVFSTDMDDQTSFRITCVQGKSKKASENTKLGEFIIYGIPRKPARQEKIIVNMTINSMGILEVSATSVTTKTGKGIKIFAERLDSDGELER